MNFCEPVGNGNPPVVDLNSPDSINEGLLSTTTLNVLSPHTVETNNKRHPSPYYYGDLFKYKTEKSKSVSQTAPQQPQPVNVNSNNKTKCNQKTNAESKSQNNKKNSGKSKKFRKSSSLDNPLESKRKNAKTKTQIKYRKSLSVETQSINSK